MPAEDGDRGRPGHSVKNIGAYLATQGRLYRSGQNPIGTLPLFLSAAVVKAKTADDFLDQVLEIRQKASSFRAHHVSLHQAIAQGDAKSAREMQRALASDRRRLRKSFVGMALAGGSAVALPLIFANPVASGTIAAATILGGLAVYPQEEWLKLRERALKPSTGFLMDARSYAGALMDSADAVFELWPVAAEKQRVFADRFDQLQRIPY